MLCSKNADRTGLEPATSAVTGRHSNQLNYRSIQFWEGKNKAFSIQTKQKLKNRGIFSLVPIPQKN